MDKNRLRRHSYMYNPLEAVKRWLINKERSKIFADAQRDILLTMEDDLNKRAEELANKKLKDLVSLFDVGDIVALKGNQVYINGNQASDTEVSNLKAEADFLIASELWKVLNGNPREMAMKSMFVDDGKLETQLLKGRAILFTLATQQKIIETLSTAKS